MPVLACPSDKFGLGNPKRELGTRLLVTMLWFLSLQSSRDESGQCVRYRPENIPHQVSQVSVRCCPHVHVHVPMCARPHVHVHVPMCARPHVCTSLPMYMCMYMSPCDVTLQA